MARRAPRDRLPEDAAVSEFLWRGEADTPEGYVEVIVDGGGCGMAEGSEAPTTLNWSANCARNVSGAPAVWEHR